MQFALTDSWKRRHASAALMNHLDDLLRRQPFVDIEQRRECRWGAAAIRSMADRALISINDCAGAAQRAAFDQPTHPRNVIGVDEHHAALGIGRESSPLCAAVETWKHNRLLANREWSEWAAADELFELFHRPR